MAAEDLSLPLRESWDNLGYVTPEGIPRGRLLAEYEAVMAQLAEPHKPWRQLPIAPEYEPIMAAPRPRAEFAEDAVDRYRLITYVRRDPQTGAAIFTHTLSGEESTSLLMRTAFEAHHEGLELANDQIITVQSRLNAQRVLSRNPMLRIPEAVAINDWFLPPQSQAEHEKQDATDIDSAIRQRAQEALHSEPRKATQYLARKLKGYTEVMNRWDLDRFPAPKVPIDQWVSASKLAYETLSHLANASPNQRIARLFDAACPWPCLTYSVAVLAAEYGITDPTTMSSIVTHALL